MSNRKDLRQGASSKDKVQDLGVPLVSKKPDGGVAVADSIRMLDSETFLAHYRHLRDARTVNPDAGACCRATPESLVLEVPAAIPEPELVQSAGADEEKPDTPPPGNWWDRR